MERGKKKVKERKGRRWRKIGGTEKWGVCLATFNDLPQPQK